MTHGTRANCDKKQRSSSDVADEFAFDRAGGARGYRLGVALLSRQFDILSMRVIKLSHIVNTNASKVVVYKFGRASWPAKIRNVFVAPPSNTIRILTDRTDARIVEEL